MQHRAVFGEVDLLAAEKRADPLGEVALARIGDKQRHRFRDDALLRPVDEPVVPGERKPRKALGIGIEERGERPPGQCAPVVKERLPSGIQGRVDHDRCGHTTRGSASAPR